MVSSGAGWLWSLFGGRCGRQCKPRGTGNGEGNGEPGPLRIGQNRPVAIPQHFIQELLARVDIVEVVGRYVQLKKGGANFMGLCPFHGEKSPSFSVSPSKQFFHCFGCGKNGNAIGFLMDHTGAGFVEAVKDLAQQVGLQVPEEDIPPQERARAAEQRQKQQTLTDVLAQAAVAYKAQLKHSERAVAYLKGRGLSGDVARTFGLGYAPEGWRFLSTVFPDYQSPLLTESGLVISHAKDGTDGADGANGPDRAQRAERPGGAQEEKRYDRFRDRIMFPIRNVKGETIGFGGRVLDKGEPKYLNSPETPVFSKGHELYGLFEARTAIRQAGFALVTEGYMDVVALAQLGFGNAVATLGTACTPDHVRKLFRFTDSVVFSFDGDAAGRRAARKALDAALPWASDTRSVKFLFLPAEHDPDSYVRENGSDAFAERIREAVPLSRFLLDASAADCDLGTAEGRARMASQAQPLWHLLPDGALKRQLLAELADQVGLDTRELAQLWKVGGERGPATNPRADHPERGRDTRSGRPRYPDAAPPASGYTGAARTAEPTTRRARTTLRKGLLAREDRAARLVLSTPEAWDWLSTEDHELLGHLPEPHGTLFAWLEGQWHEHGPQPWAALSAGMQGQPFEAWARELFHSASALDSEPATEEDARAELRDLLRRMHIEALNLRATQAIAEARTNPEALGRYRAITERIRLLQLG